MLDVRGIKKSFGSLDVIKNVSFKVEPGEIVSIIGPSGGGKTTLLRCINGLEKCDGGTIKIDKDYLCRESEGRISYLPPKEVRRIRRNLGMVFQGYNLFPHMSAMENIMEPLISVASFTKEDAKSRGMELLQVMGLSDKGDFYPCQLSGGQKQRVAIARALALNPKIICFDEPTSALDPQLREGVANLIRDLTNENIAVLIITHDMIFARRVSHRVLFVEEGKIIRDDITSNFFEDMKNQRIVEYIK